MMAADIPVRIRPQGRFFPRDEAGYLVNDGAWEKIGEPWRSLVVAWRSRCQAVYGSNLVAVYLRGSIPRGQAVAGVSDLDGVLVLRCLPMNPAAQPEAIEAAVRSQAKVETNFCTRIETQTLVEDEVLQPESPWGRLLKLSGLCIGGEDICQALPPVPFDRRLVVHAPQLAQNLDRVCQHLRETPPPTPQRVRRQCRWLSRRLLRSGFELVMLHEGSYTRDLYPCYATFSRHVPEREREMRRALLLALSPSANRAGLLAFWQEFGGWLVAEIERGRSDGLT